ncbi:MAG: glycosyltransferase family 4 protein [Solirubrobacteraceae bacterium]
MALADGGMPAVQSPGRRPIRFCMLSTFYPPWHFGGDAIHVQRLAHALAAQGHEVTVVHSPQAHRVLSRDRPRESVEHGAVDVVPLGDTLPSLVATYLTGRPWHARRQLETVLERDFDVLHFHNPSLLGAPALVEAGEGIKLYTAHEQWLLCASHVLWRRSGRVCAHPPCWSCEITHGRPPQLWRRTGMLERCLGHLDALIAPSRTSARLHRRFAGHTRIEVLEHFVPDRRHPAAARGQDGPFQRPRRPYFLYAGRLEPIKGVAGLIEVISGRSETLVIAGDGGLVRPVRRAARRLPNVNFAGWLSSGELDALYRDALAVVVPTLGHEAFGLVAAEAFAHGTPAVVRRFGALAELAAETGAALTFEGPAELDDALGRIAGDAAIREELGQRARIAYMERFTVDGHLRRYLSLIADLARRRGDDGLARAAEAGHMVGAAR